MRVRVQSGPRETCLMPSVLPRMFKKRKAVGKARLRTQKQDVEDEGDPSGLSVAERIQQLKVDIFFSLVLK